MIIRMQVKQSKGKMLQQSAFAHEFRLWCQFTIGSDSLIFVVLRVKIDVALYFVAVTTVAVSHMPYSGRVLHLLAVHCATINLLAKKLRQISTDLLIFFHRSL